MLVRISYFFNLFWKWVDHGRISTLSQGAQLYMFLVSVSYSLLSYFEYSKRVAWHTVRPIPVERMEWPWWMDVWNFHMVNTICICILTYIGATLAKDLDYSYSESSNQRRNSEVKHKTEKVGDLFKAFALNVFTRLQLIQFRLGKGCRDI